MLKSIYQELLEISEQQTFNAISFDDFIGGYEDEDYDDDENGATQNGGEQGDVIFMPLERTFLCLGDEIQIDIDDLHFAALNIPLDDTTLKDYIDGSAYRQFPIAVSFLMDRGDYIKYARELLEEEKAIISYSNGACHSFEDGIQILDITAANNMVKLIMGFAREGTCNAQLSKAGR